MLQNALSNFQLSATLTFKQKLKARQNLIMALGYKMNNFKKFFKTDYA